MNAHVVTALESSADSAILAFGAKTQSIKACEEMGELITQLAKHLNGSPTTEEKIIDEIADVLVTVFQMRHLYGGARVDAQILFKLDRMMQAIRNRGKLND